MITNPFLQNFPLLLETEPELFSTADLQDLQQTLAPLENDPPKNADLILGDWCKTRPSIVDALIRLENLQNTKELTKVPPSKANESARITNTFPELSEKVKEKLSERTDSTEFESAQPDQNQNND
ncbi:hypothetical protein [Okeania sp.]|uniref:hypothetical protein n=1 Tax=Okeania sp. TaxID=3100323 RepID=UPI002B4B6B0D|nr:hypothetical protein [Okeania sp.]MEB3343262.1 hypothetical protein [Okeania sp.]